MNRIRKILVATDFSPASRHALDHAQVLAATLGAQVHVLSVHIRQSNLHGLVNFPNLDEIETQLESQVRDGMDQFLAGCDGAFVSNVFTADDETPAILSYAHEQDIDLIVVGTHGRNAASRFFLGSVAVELLRTAPVPVLVAGPEHALDPAAFQKILVPVDFSDTSLGVLKYADSIATAFKARLDVVHVTDSHSLPPYYARDFGDEQQRMAERAMQKLLAAASIGTEYTSLVRMGDPDDAIAELAGEKQSDLIITASANRSRLSQMLLGSTTDRVIRKAPCAVLAWREAQSRVPRD